MVGAMLSICGATKPLRPLVKPSMAELPDRSLMLLPWGKLIEPSRTASWVSPGATR